MTNLLSFWLRFAPQHPRVVGISPAETSLATVQALAPHVRTQSIEADQLPQWKPDRSPSRIDLLFLDDIRTLQNARELLFKNRLDALVIPNQPDTTSLLAYHQFNFFVASNGNIASVPPPQLSALPPGTALLAMHHRFTTPVLAGNQHMDLPALFKRYAVEARGVVHVGAHDGEELDLYSRMGFKRVLFIEANPTVFARLMKRVGNRAGVTCILCAASDTNGLELLHITTNDESSSLLPLKRHAELYPQIKEESQALVAARRLDHLLLEIGQNPADYNFLHLDIQGAELKALKGAVMLLPGIDAISTEVNYEELYEGCPLVEELDDFLEPFTFERMFTATPRHPQWGDAFYLRKPSVSMRKLGQWGRFGNQVFEYAFTKCFAKRHHLHVQTSPWIGNQLFGANDPIVSAQRQYPQHLESTYTLKDSQVANLPFRPANIDLCGVFQYHSSYYAPDKDYFRKLLSPVPALKKTLNNSLQAAMTRANAKTLVALHLRRGDYGFGLFFVSPSKWYLDWLAAFWPSLDAPALYIATDDPANVLPEFSRYSPIAAADLKVPTYGADFYTDYYILSQAHHVATSNSSFSFSACMLNEVGTTFLRPDLFQARLIPFDPWNAEPLLHRELGILDQREMANILPHYLANPGDGRLANAIRSGRLQLAESFVQITGAQIPTVLSMYFWGAYLTMRQANLRPHPLVDVEKQALSRYQQRLTQVTGMDAIGPFIAASLFVDPRTLPAVDLSMLPAAIQEILRT